MRAAELYQVYREWAKENGQYVMSSTKFGLEISKRYNKTRNSRGQYVYIGVRIEESHKPYALNYKC